MAPTVSIVTVSMNRMENLRPCLDNIRKHTKISYETFVVAYMFSPENLRALKEEYPWVTVVDSGELRGFAENNNLALGQVTGEYTFIVNDDTYMEMPVIDALVEDFGKAPDDVAAISPKILFPDERVQTCGRRYLNAWTYMAHYLHLLDETRPTRWSMRDGLFRTKNLNGACFLIKTEVFRQAGWFDETYTFTPEDIALGTLLDKRGYKLFTDADVKIYHIANATASSIEAAIKPTRVRGSLIFYSSFAKLRSPQKSAHNDLIYILLGLYIWLIEAVRGTLYLFRDTSDPKSHNSIMAQTAKNVRHSIFTHRSTKEIFTGYYRQIKGK